MCKDNCAIKKVMPKQLTLCIPHQENRVLLGMKKRGFGEGRWNGFGGKLEEGETIEQAAAREVREECGIEISDMNKLGVVQFSWPKNEEQEDLEVHIFKVRHFSGEPTETEEMRPAWFMLDEIPFTAMWPDDPYWFPYFLKDRMFEARFSFDEADTIIDMQVKEV